MASEMDRQTRTGLLTACKKVEEVCAALNDIKPENDDFGRRRTRCRALSTALSVDLYHLLEEAVALSRGGGSSKAQLSLDGLLSETSKAEPLTATEDSQAAVREAAENPVVEEEDAPAKPKPEKKPKAKPKPKKAKPEAVADPEPEEEPEPEPGTDPDEPEPGEEVEAPPTQDPDDVPEEVQKRKDEFDAPDLTQAALQSAKRTIALSVIEGWTIPERSEARRWAAYVRENGETPAPAHVAGPHLEDLDLATEEGLATLLAFHEIDGDDVDESAGEEREALVAWAEARHRQDRGEEIAVPNPPSMVLPSITLFSEIFAEVREAGGTATRDALVRKYGKRDFGAIFAIEALLSLGALVLDDADAGKIAADDGVFADLDAPKLTGTANGLAGVLG